MNYCQNSTTEHIEIKYLRKIFKKNGVDNLVLDINSLKIKKGDFVSLVGASGCGKTTLLNIIAGFISYESGEVNFFGKRDLLPGSDRVCVFQEDAIFPWMTVAENIGYGLKRSRKNNSEISFTVDKYIKLVGLQGKEQHFPRELSGGMKKRVDFARAFASFPETILMDEPFGALDYRTKKDLQNWLKNFLLEELKTVLFVTHDIEEALFLSDRVLVLSKSPGRVISDIDVPFEKRRNKSICDTSEFIKLRNKIEGIITSNIE